MSSSSSGSGSLNPDKVGNAWPSCVCAHTVWLCLCHGYLRQHVALLVPQRSSGASSAALLCLTLRYFVAAFYRKSFAHTHTQLATGLTWPTHTDYLPAGEVERGSGDHGQGQAHTSGSHPLRLIQKNYKRCLVLPVLRVNLIIYLIVF